MLLVYYSSKFTHRVILTIYVWLYNVSSADVQKRSKIKKLNINTKFCVFKLVYCWVRNRRGCWNKRDGGGIENLIAGLGWRTFWYVWYVKIEYKEAEVFWVTNDRQNESSSLVGSSNTFNKNVNKHSSTSAKWGQ